MLIIYTTYHARSQIQLRAKDQTIWPSRREMALLFDTSTDSVRLHSRDIFEDEESRRNATSGEHSAVQTEDGREVQRPLTLCDLDAILAIGYRVRSPRASLLQCTVDRTR